MEAASLPASQTGAPAQRVREAVGRYGLIVLLAAMPVAFAIADLARDGSLSRLGNNLVDGLSNGAIWALVAIGYTLVYGIVELINFAHGEVFIDRKSTRLNSSHANISYAVFCLKKKPKSTSV